MKRTTAITLTSIAALLAVAACQPTATSAGSSDQASSTPHAAASTHSAATSSTKPASAKPTTKPSSKATSCPDRGDIYVWMRTAGVPDTTQRLGGTDPETCKPSFNLFASNAPTVPGSCTEGAWVSDNPGYDENATPSARLKKVQFSVGPAC
jgi:hypothetical protein